MVHRRSEREECRGGSPGLTVGATRARLATILVGAVLCGCHATQHPASPTTSTTAPAPTTTTQPAAPAVNIQPLPVRPVQKSQPTTSNKCPATNPNAPAAPGNVLVTCDLARTTLYTLAPETMQLGLTHVDPPNALTSGFYEVNLTMDPPSAAAWAAFTAAHLHAHVAFIRDDLVLEAPIIEEQVTSGKIALTTQTPQAADQLARLAGRPA
jgi:preprotein translocase subunit SecD